MEANDKMQMLESWILNHTSHPDFFKITSDRNHLSVKINALEFKIAQLENGDQLLGDQEVGSGFDIDKLTNSHTNGYRPIQ